MVTVAPGSTAPLASLTRAGEAAESLLRPSRAGRRGQKTSAIAPVRTGLGRFAVRDRSFRCSFRGHATPRSGRAPSITRRPVRPRDAVCHGTGRLVGRTVTSGRARAVRHALVTGSLGHRAGCRASVVRVERHDSVTNCVTVGDGCAQRECQRSRQNRNSGFSRRPYPSNRTPLVPTRTRHVPIDVPSRSFVTR